MTRNTGKEGEKIIEGWWTKNKNLSSGPFKIKGNNFFNGTIEMVKNGVNDDDFNFFYLLTQNYILNINLVV